MKLSIPDFCPACDAVDNPFVPAQRETEQDFRGQTLRVTSPAFRCRHCGFSLLGPGHLDALRLATHDAYRRRHGLLTTAEIISRRKAMGLSQKRFAETLGVGSASIERWESGVLVQDKASDILLRQRSDHTRFLPSALSGKRTDRTIFQFTRMKNPSAIGRANKNYATFHFTSPSASTPTLNPSHALTPAA